jgi:hypothetical protein
MLLQVPDVLTSEQVAFFEQKVRPLLIERCFTCHSEAKKVNGGLRLDSRRGLIEGGDSGPAILPGKPEESLLIKAVRYQNTDLQMPPDGKLAAAELAVLEEWVRMGAPDPRAEKSPDAGMLQFVGNQASRLALQGRGVADRCPRRHGIDSPVDENAKLRILVPCCRRMSMERTVSTGVIGRSQK